MIVEVLIECVIVVTFAVIGLALMMAGYFIVDVLTPGKLHEQVWVHRSKNAATLVASNLFAVALIVCAAIYTSEDDFALGVVTTLIYGVIGLLAMGLSFVIIDALTPGKLRDVVNEVQLHPATWVSASAHVSIALIMCFALL